MLIKCRTCNIELNEQNAVPLYGKHKQLYKTPFLRLCKKCKRIYRREMNRKKLIKLKLELSCEKCGYNKNIAALDFHHKDNSEKRFQIATNLNRTFGQIKREIDKCEILCANCHREKHFPLMERSCLV